MLGFVIVSSVALALFVVLVFQGDRGEIGLPGPPGEKGSMVGSMSRPRLCLQVHQGLLYPLNL